MRHALIAATLAAGVFAATAAAAETRSFDLKGFTRVTASAGTDVVVTVGPEHSVVAEGDAKAIERLDVKIEDDTLVIGRKASMMLFQRSKPVTVRVSLPVLSAVVANSGADVTATDVDAAEFRLKASSGANIKASGICIGLSVEASSGGDVEASDLKCEMATAEASSGGDVDLYATKSVVAEASSGGDVTVRGGPENVEVDKSSGGDVKILNIAQ